MIERLRLKRDLSDRGLRRLAELVEAVPPLHDSTARARRVRARLDASWRPSAGRSKKKLALLVLLSGGLAFAGTLTVRKLMATPRALTAPMAPTPTTPMPPRVQMPPAVPMPAVTPLAPSVMAAAAPPPTQLLHAPPHATPLIAPASTPTIAEPAPPSLAAFHDGGSRLLAVSVKALRRDGDPSLAQGLAEEYLDRHPDGALAEEALALALEAARARGATTEASGFAARYLVHFPNGRFAAQARATLR